MSEFEHLRVLLNYVQRVGNSPGSINLIDAAVPSDPTQPPLSTPLAYTSLQPASLTLPTPSTSSPQPRYHPYSARSPRNMSSNIINAHDDEDMEADLLPGNGGVDVNGVRHFCVVCGDESDGLHFGQYTCRACAAFFRRTVSLRLEYTCKHNNMCEIEKNARNMCRSCRFQKCLNKGMQTSAVQHARDGIGKRREPQKRPKESFSDSTASQPTPQQTVIDNSPTTSSITNGSLSFASTPTSTDGNKYSLAYQPTNSVTGLANALYQQYNQESGGYGVANTDQQATILQLGQGLNVEQSPVPYVMNSFANVNLQQLTQAAARTAFAQPREADMKLLNRMLEGYQHFRSLRKASYTLIDETPRLQKNVSVKPFDFRGYFTVNTASGAEIAGDLSQSNYDTSKKHCKIEASLLMDTVEKFYLPFGTLSKEDQNALFDNFFCNFTNAERSFRSYKLFPAGDDRLIMPDGGYVRLKELTTFYENSSSIRGDPSQLAGIFENAMSYIVNIVINRMRNLGINEMELIALSGIMLWKDSKF
uniref:Nuclear receptor domain-containing protein n=1 Tax=Bursaphelenchus xylophilus TaxID=6326 RepID=A0A1I7S9N4_BURXY